MSDDQVAWSSSNNQPFVDVDQNEPQEQVKPTDVSISLSDSKLSLNDQEPTEEAPIFIE